MDIENFFKTLSGKIVILGMGNPLRGDDGVGSYIAKQLQNKLKATIIDCEDKPERYLQQIIFESPDIVLFIDAVNMRVEPGAFALIESKNFDNEIIFTHKSSLKAYTDYINKNTNSQVFILGIQPKSIAFGSNISKIVMETAEVLKNLLIHYLSSE